MNTQKQNAQDTHHVCFSGSLACSGPIPCPHCFDLINRHVLVFAMRQSLTLEQAAVFFQWYEEGWRVFHESMAQDARLAELALNLSRVRIDPLPTPGGLRSPVATAPLPNDGFHYPSAGTGAAPWLTRPLGPPPPAPAVTAPAAPSPVGFPEQRRDPRPVSVVTPTAMPQSMSTPMASTPTPMAIAGASVFAFPDELVRRVQDGAPAAVATPAPVTSYTPTERVDVEAVPLDRPAVATTPMPSTAVTSRPIESARLTRSDMTAEDVAMLASPVDEIVRGDVDGSSLLNGASRNPV